MATAMMPTSSSRSGRRSPDLGEEPEKSHPRASGSGWTATGSAVITLLARQRDVGVRLDCADCGGRGHQVVVPAIAIDHHVGGGAEQDRLDQVVVDVGV